VREVLAAIKQVTGLEIPTRLAPRRAGDPPALVANPARARAVLGWQTQRDLAEIVRTAAAWHRR
jgi:UDP-glucose 4-epimerase